MRKTMFILVALVFLVAACLPAQDTQELEARVNTAVAETMAVENQIANSVEQTVVALEPLASPTAETVDAALTFTETPTPTATPLSIDTFTPFPVNPTATRRASTQAQYACSVINRRPFDLSEYNPGDKFDIKWTIVNIGSRAWVAGIDVKYVSGPKMSVSRVQIPKALNPNDSYTIVMDAVAPNKKGRQVMTFAVDGPMCFPYVAIIVK